MAQADESGGASRLEITNDHLVGAGITWTVCCLLITVATSVALIVIVLNAQMAR